MRSCFYQKACSLFRVSHHVHKRICKSHRQSEIWPSRTNLISPFYRNHKTHCFTSLGPRPLNTFSGRRASTAVKGSSDDEPLSTSLAPHPLFRFDSFIGTFFYSQHTDQYLHFPRLLTLHGHLLMRLAFQDHSSIRTDSIKPYVHLLHIHRHALKAFCLNH